MAAWSFYGRKEQLRELATVFGRGRWFFAKVTGRRRIGKTTLIRQALREVDAQKPVWYVQIPDSEPVGVLSAVSDALDTFQVPAERFPRPHDLLQFARLLEDMATEGYVIVLDEFQYFHRKGYEEFCSHLQASVDRLSARSESTPGGLVVLGSIHTEMVALLEDLHAPLFNRVTDDIQLAHLDIGSILAILRDHANDSPSVLLFLWNLFEGVPKFYRDCYEQQVLNADRLTLLRRIFFESSSPLRSEAENWFLRELRGRYDAILKFVARQPGCSHGDIVDELRKSGAKESQAGGYLQTLIERYRLIDKKLPVFSKTTARSGRYYLTDNFLRSWLAALASQVQAREFRPTDELIAEADRRLADIEGAALEKLAGQLYEERSRRKLGDFSLTDRIQGYWDKAGTEIDLVAVDKDSRILRFGSCKRSPEKLLANVNNLKGHVDRFLQSKHQYDDWTKEYVGIAPELSREQRAVLNRHGVIAQDLRDLTQGL